MTTLDRNSDLPLRAQLRNLLQRHIIDGAYRPGEPFPTEREISARYHVSRTTIREALSDLVRLGYLVRQQGKGTFVARTHDAFDATRLSSFTEDMAKRGLTADVRLLRLAREEPDESCRRHFGESVGPVWRIHRLRLADREPIALQTSFMPVDRFPFAREELASGSLYRLLAERFGLRVESADEVIAATTATPEEAALLGVASGAPLLHIDRYTYAQTGEAIEVVRILYRADRYKFYVHQNRGG